MNAMFVFVMAAQGIFAGFVNGWYFEHPENNLVRMHFMTLMGCKNDYRLKMISYKCCLQVSWIQEHVFNDVWNSERVGTILYVIFAEITFWSVVSGILHKLGIYWKL